MHVKILQMNFLYKIAILSALFGVTILLSSYRKPPLKPTDVRFHTETLIRLNNPGDNWYIAWTPEGHQVTSMCDGNWLNGKYRWNQMEITLELDE